MKRKKLVLYLVFLVLCLYILAPIYWLVMGAFVPERLLLTRPPTWIPTEITLDNVKRSVLCDLQYLKGFQDSLIIAFFTATLCFSLGSLAAYPFARMKFPGRMSLLTMILAVQTLPGITVLIPLFIMIKNWGLFDTYQGVIISEVGFILPFIIWILTVFFQSIPFELEESAQIDGCSRLQAFARIVLPLAATGLITAYVIAFLNSWGDLLFQLVLTRSEVTTVPVVIATSNFNYWEDYAAMVTQGLFAAIPAIALVLIFQKYIAKGLLAGSIKG